MSEYIGRAMGISRQAAQSLFESEGVTDNGFMKYGTQGALLTFFHAEGMPITIADLFSVEATDEDDGGL